MAEGVFVLGIYFFPTLYNVFYHFMFAEGKKILKGRIKLIVRWDIFFSSLHPPLTDWKSIEVVVMVLMLVLNSVVEMIVVVVVGVMILLLLVPVVVGGVDVRL